MFPNRVFALLVTFAVAISNVVAKGGSCSNFVYGADGRKYCVDPCTASQVAYNSKGMCYDTMSWPLVYY